MSLKRLGEFGLIQRLTAGLPKRRGALRQGVGDDCAVIRIPGSRDLLATTDMLIEGVHFRSDWSSMEEIGRKAMLANISDIAAMGGKPRFGLVAVGLPPRSSLQGVDAMFRGLRREARRAGVLLVGGDTDRSQRLLITVTLLGDVEKGRALTRDGARPGDILYVTGRLGEGGRALAAKSIFIPPLRVSVGRELVRKKLAQSCIDISDGFLQDLTHLLRESCVGAEIEVDRLPGSAPTSLKLTSGDDYEILFSTPPRVKIPKKIHGVRVTRVGRILPWREGVRMVDRRGREVPLPRRLGYSHF